VKGFQVLEMVVAGNNKVCFSFDGGRQVFIVLWVIFDLLELYFARDDKADSGRVFKELFNFFGGAVVKLLESGI
jgi:hypothetical protein